MSNMSKDNNGSQNMDNASEKVNLISSSNSEKKNIRFRGSSKSIKPHGNRVENINVLENPQHSKKHNSTKKCGIVFILNLNT